MSPEQNLSKSAFSGETLEPQNFSSPNRIEVEPSALEHFNQLLNIDNKSSSLNDGSEWGSWGKQLAGQSLYIHSDKESEHTGLRLFYLSSFISVSLLLLNSFFAPAMSANRPASETRKALDSQVHQGVYDSVAIAQINQVKALLADHQRQLDQIERARLMGPSLPFQHTPDGTNPSQVSEQNPSFPQTNVAGEQQVSSEQTLNPDQVSIARISIPSIHSEVPEAYPATDENSSPIVVPPPEVIAVTAPPKELVVSNDELQAFSNDSFPEDSSTAPLEMLPPSIPAQNEMSSVATTHSEYPLVKSQYSELTIDWASPSPGAERLMPLTSANASTDQNQSVLAQPLGTDDSLLRSGATPPQAEAHNDSQSHLENSYPSIDPDLEAPVLIEDY